MRVCEKCNVEMMEDPKMYMTALVTGPDSWGCGSEIVIEEDQTVIQSALGWGGDRKIRLHVYTAICPTCGRIENYVSAESLLKINEYKREQEKPKEEYIAPYKRLLGKKKEDEN